MLSQFQNSRARRQFLALSGSISAAVALGLLVLSYLRADTGASSGVDEISSSDRFWEAIGAATQLFLASVLGGSITAAFLVVVFGILYDEERSLETVAVCDPTMTNDLHEEALATTEFWNHNGHIGRWVRIRALSALRASATSRGTPRSVAFIILNPLNDSLCQRYAEYREVLAPAKYGVNKASDVKVQVVATVIAAASAGRSSSLDVKLFFKDELDFSRLDISSTMAFRTLADPKSVAVAYSKQSDLQRHTFYEAARMSFLNAMEEAIEVSLDAADLPDDVTGDDLTDDRLSLFLEANSIENAISSSDYDRVRAELKKDSHPYR